MACVNENSIFDSFICRVQDCPNQISNNSIILNCFHSICSTHIQTGNVVYCAEEPCHSFSQNNPDYVSLPAQQHRCVNVVNTQVANQLLCLYNTRLQGAKCGLCGVREDDMELCIDCPSVRCNAHKKDAHHRLYGANHHFESLQSSNEKILNLALRRKVTRRADNNRLDEQIATVLRNKESIDNRLAGLQAFMDRVHNNTREVIEDANASFEKIIRHIEQMKIDLFERLNNKSDEILRDHQEKYMNLQFRSSAAERALILHKFVRESRMRVTDKFVRMFSNDSLSFAEPLYTIAQPPIESRSIPTILHKIQEHLEFLHLTVPPIPCDATYYFKGEMARAIPTYRGVELGQLLDQRVIFVKINHFPSINTRSYAIYHKNNVLEENDNVPESCNLNDLTIPVPLAVDKVNITKIVCTWTTDNTNIPPESITLYVAPNRLSTFSITPGRLSSVAKSGDKLFGISQNGKEIIRLDCPPHLIYNQMDKQEPSNWAIEESFGFNHLITPKGICVLRGQVYVSDESHHAVFCFSDDGTFLVRFGRLGSQRGQFNKPMGLTGDQEHGRLIIADSGNCRVQIFRLNHDWEYFELREDIEEDDFPIDVKLDTLGSFYVLTNSRAILLYDKKFAYRSSVLHPDTIEIKPFFAMDTNDVIYLCSEADGTVCTIRHILNEVCNFNTVRGIPTSLKPVGLMVDEEGRLYLTHHKTNDHGPPSTLVYILTQDAFKDI